MRRIILYNSNKHVRVFLFALKRYVTGLVVLAFSVIAVMFILDEGNRFSISICLGVLAVLIICSLIHFRKSNGQEV